MTDLPASLRERLSQEACLDDLKLVRELRARDGTRKLLFGLPDGQAIETVVLPFEDRTSVCVSSQVGCPIRCTFCATGQSGYSRNLSSGEIVGQLLASRRLTGRKISHVVFMGMGEPLLNLPQVLHAVHLMHDEAGIPVRHITISTVGLVREMRELAEENEAFTLAVSLHAPNDELRQSLIPVARKYRLKELLDACSYYMEKTGRRVTFEYVLLRGVNDRPEHARELANLLRGRHSHVNLIPYNPGASDEYEAPVGTDVRRFREILELAGITATQRLEKGREIMAACGQLRKQTVQEACIDPPVSLADPSHEDASSPDADVTGPPPVACLSTGE
jgi:23S rRNA (adenine2503-C2)-methyltransferase